MCPSCEIACCSGVYERTSRRALLALGLSLLLIFRQPNRGASLSTSKKTITTIIVLFLHLHPQNKISQHANPLFLFMPLKSKHALQQHSFRCLPFGLSYPWEPATCGNKLTCTKSTSPLWLDLMCTYHFCIDFV